MIATRLSTFLTEGQRANETKPSLPGSHPDSSVADTDNGGDIMISATNATSGVLEADFETNAEDNEG
jgi:hypothetical protein